MMTKWLTVFLAAGVLTACGGGGGGEGGSGMPTASSSNARTSTVSTVSLSWLPPTQNTYGSALTNLTGYKILYGRNSNTLSESIQIQNPSVNTYVVENLTAGTWYFTVKAVTGNGMESDGSNIASKTI